jgi:hypothetical protein
MSHFSQLCNLYILFNTQNSSSLCHCVNSKQSCSCEHNDDVWETGGGVQLCEFCTFTLNGAKWSAACPNHIMAEEESLICTVQEAWWDPQPVWTFWRTGNFLFLPGNKLLFLSCPASSPFTTLNELSCLMYNCVRLTDRTYCIGTAAPPRAPKH